MRKVVNRRRERDFRARTPRLSVSSVSVVSLSQSECFEPGFHAGLPADDNVEISTAFRV